MKRPLVILAAVILIMNIANALAEVSYRTVRVDDLDIFYREAGPKDGPAILLLHGLPSSSRMYQPLLESDLANQYHLVAPDYPGFGHSSWPDPKSFAYTFDHLAQIIEDFTEPTASGTLHAVHARLRWPGGFSYGLGSSRKSSGDDYPKCRLARRRPISALGRSACFLGRSAGPRG